MSASNKTRFEVQTILRSCIIQGLTQFSQTGWDVMEFANASFEKANKVVLMNLIKCSRVGWQAQKYPVTASVLGRREEWIEEQNWQLSTILKRTDATDDTSILAEDVSQMLITWFNGPGADYLRKSGVAPLRVDTESVIVYNDNSELYQKRAVFTVKIQVPKVQLFGQNKLNAVEPHIRPV